MEIKIDTSELPALENEAKTVVDIWRSTAVDSPEMFKLAGEELVGLKRQYKLLQEKKTAITKPINDGLKAVRDLFKPAEEYLDAGMSTIQRLMSEWTEKERIRIEAARKEAEEATRKAKEEQERIAREAAEAARKAQESGDAAAARDLQARASQAEMMAQVVVATPVMTEATKADGLTQRETWSARLVDIVALAKAVADGKAPPECLAVNQTFINSQARAFKKSGELYPGVVAESKLSQALSR